MNLSADMSERPADDLFHGLSKATKPAMRHEREIQISASLLPIKDEGSHEILNQCLAAARSGVEMLHFDVIGNQGAKTCVCEEGSVDTAHQFTPTLISELAKELNEENLVTLIDVHLMDEGTPNQTVMEWLRAGVDCLTLHWEAFNDPEALRQRLSLINEFGAKAGIAIRPDTNLDPVIAFIVRNSELVQVVSQNGVLPCLGGQTLDHSIMNNLRDLKVLCDKLDAPFQIMVDGGIEPEITGPKCFMEGADILVAGSAFFGNGHRDVVTMQGALGALKTPSAHIEYDVYDILADHILSLRRQKEGRTWVRIESYHGGGKTFTADSLRKKLLQRGEVPILVGLDLSWTDRTKRAEWQEEAYAARSEGRDHPYFHPLSQTPEPHHWRKAHSDRMISLLEGCESGMVEVPGCYQFNLTGDTDGVCSFDVKEDSIILVEGVYASLLEKSDWDATIYIDSNPDYAEERAVVRDAIKVRRAPSETRRLYHDVYRNAYEEYLQATHARETASIVLDHNEVDSAYMPKRARIVASSSSELMLECTEESCREQKPIRRLNSCPSCGGDLQNTIVGPVDFLASIDESITSMWRYQKLLPVEKEHIVTAHEGMTPIRYLAGLSDTLGVNVWAKLEIVNPTGTFKDREASYVVSLSKQYGQENLVMQSTGNTAMAITHYAGLAQIPSWSFIPLRSSYKLWMPPKAKTSRIIAVAGHPIDVKAVADDFAACFTFPKISPFFERCEANIMQSYEAGEDILRGRLEAQELLKGGSFDYYVQTLSAGMGLIGFHEGMKRLAKWTDGRIAVPKIAAIEISEFAPAHKAWEEDKDRVGLDASTPFFPVHTLYEPTLWTTNITRYYPHLYSMLKSSGGSLDSIMPSEVEEMEDKYRFTEILKGMGYQLSDTEKAPLIEFAGLAKKVERGEIPRGSNVIIFVTGKGRLENFVKVEPDFIFDPTTNKPKDILDRLG